MDTQKIQAYFSASDKILLGVCAAVSGKVNLPTLVVRIILLIITLLFIPFGILAYLILYLVLVSKKGKVVTFFFAGAILGIPLSYYFQPEMVKHWEGESGVFGYLANLPSIMDEYHQYVDNAWALLGNIMLSIIIFALVGGAVGYYLAKNKKSNQS